MSRWGHMAVVVAVVASCGVASAAVQDDLRDGDRLFEDGAWQKAASAYDRAINQAGGGVPAEAYGKRAAIFIILRDYKGGLEFVAKAKARYPTAPEILEQEALMLWETDRHDEAIVVAEQVVAARPTAFTNQKLVGEWYATRDPRRTATAYAAYLAARPAELEAGDVLPRVRLGFAELANARAAIADGDDARAQKRFANAALQFEILLRKHAKRPNAQANAENGLCAAYTGMGRFDQAVAVCERVAASPRRIDASGSVWFNLGTAYLARQQTAKARSAARDFIRMRRNEARGYLLLGDTFFADRDWAGALAQYQRAEKLTAPLPVQVQLSIRLGKTYRRMPPPASFRGSGPNPNVELAIGKLAGALASNPGSVELAVELGSAYLETRQDAKAAALADGSLGQASGAKAPADARASLLLLAGKAQFNQGELPEARQRFEAAYELRPRDVTVQRALVLTINEQAFAASGEDGALETGAGSAQALLEQALAIEPRSTITLLNLAVLALERGECSRARTQLGKVESIRGHDPLLRARLAARAHLCGTRPDPTRASEQFAIAEREAKQAGATLALAEIYTEWAPLRWNTDLAGAVAQLELATEVAGKDAARRRGWKRMREGKGTDAAGDFERALKDVSVLRGAEVPAFELSRALAYLDAGRNSDAARGFETLAKQGNQAVYMKAPFAKVGTAFFAAYAMYRLGTAAALQSAATKLGKLETEGGAFAGKVRELLAATYETLAYEHFRAGKRGAAGKALAAAERRGVGDTRRRVAMDRVVLALEVADLQALETFGTTPPEALANLGILYDVLGRPREAFDAWTKAKQRGVQHRDLGRWIDAKKRIYGF